MARVICRAGVGSTSPATPTTGNTTTLVAAEATTTGARTAQPHKTDATFTTDLLDAYNCTSTRTVKTGAGGVQRQPARRRYSFQSGRFKRRAFLRTYAAIMTPNSR